MAKAKKSPFPKTITPRKKRARPPRAKQGHLPGMEPPSIPKINGLADKFVDRRDDWLAAKQPMIDARDLLFAAMKTENLNRYEYDGKVVELNVTEKVKVSPSRNGEDEDDG